MRIPTYDGSQFTWHKGEGCTCASDLGIRAADPWPANFYVRSHRTGAVKLFLPGEDIYACDGEWMGKKFFVPAGNCVITLYND